MTLIEQWPFKSHSDFLQSNKEVTTTTATTTATATATATATSLIDRAILNEVKSIKNIWCCYNGKSNCYKVTKCIKCGIWLINIVKIHEAIVFTYDESKSNARPM